MKCSALCLTLGGEAFDEAKRASTAIDRYRRGARSTGELGVGEWRVIGLSPDGDTLPIVHGLPGLEFCMVEEAGSTIRSSRDAMGTRPLYVGKSGRWVASDHRFFRGEGAELLPPGAAVVPGTDGTISRRTSPPIFGGSFDEAADRLAELISAAVRERVRGRRRVAVAFSGGLDSSIVARCASGHAKVVACSASARGSVDEAVAKESADALGIEFSSARLDASSVARELRAMDLPFGPTEMDMGLWSIYSEASRLAAEAGAELIMLGQLADEVFGGYAKYERLAAAGNGEEAQRMMEADVLACGMRGFVRDELACSRWLEPSFPFADRRVAEFGLSLPTALKFREGARKAVLREAAVRLGLPLELAQRGKKAAQYSSGVLKMIRRSRTYNQAA